MKTEERELKYVPWHIFMWAIGFIATAIVALVGYVSNANGSVAKLTTDTAEKMGKLTTDIAVIGTDVRWIKEQISTKQVTFKSK